MRLAVAFLYYVLGLTLFMTWSGGRDVGEQLYETSVFLLLIANYLRCGVRGEGPKS